MNKKSKPTRYSKEKSRRIVNILSFARRRLSFNGIRRVLINDIYKPTSSVKKQLVFKIYEIEFGNSASHDFYSNDKSLDQFRKNKTKEKRESESSLWWFEYNKYLKSPKWKEFRLLIIRLYDHSCQRCKNRFSKRFLQIHHLHYGTLGNEKPEDVLLVCKPCHEKIHRRKF